MPEDFTPSLTTLARETGCDRSSVARYLKPLESGGWLGAPWADRKEGSHQVCQDSVRDLPAFPGLVAHSH